MKIATNVNFQRATYLDGLVNGFRNSLVYFYLFEKKNSPHIDIKALSGKKNIIDVLAALELLIERTVAECQEALRKHIKTIQKSKLVSKCICV